MHISRLALILLLLGAFESQNIYPQKASERKTVICDKARAIDLTEKQIEGGRSLEKTASMIAVMVKAADLLWPYKQKKARSTLSDAFLIAQQDYKIKGDQTRMDGRLMIRLPDQRFVVLSAISKRDQAWAKELVDALPDYSTSAGSPSSETENVKRSSPADKIISLASGLDSTNRQAALGMVRSTFRYPVAYDLPSYLFKVASDDRQAADTLFLELLSNYSSGTIDDFLYLSPYAFGVRRAIGPPRGASTLYLPPTGFGSTPQIESTFLKAFFLACSRQLGEGQPPAVGTLSSGTTVWDQVASAVSAVEPIVFERFPELIEQVTILKAQASAEIPDSAQKRASAYGKSIFGEASPRQRTPLEKQIENLDKIADPNKRDAQLILTLAHLGTAEPVEIVVKAAEKVTDKEAARQLINSIYFSYTQKLINDGSLAEATKLAQKVEEIDQRAILLAQIAAKSLDSKMDRTQAAEALDAAYAAANKAPDSDAKARALLGVAALFSRMDRLRASEAMASAIKTINNLKEPNLSSKYLTRRIDSKLLSTFTGVSAPDFTIEGSFSQYGAEDFDGALWAAQKLEDRYLKAISILSLTTGCLDDRVEKIIPKGKP
jgi:tetratricopeptide (TPR) repeat protein